MWPFWKWMCLWLLFPADSRLLDLFKELQLARRGLVVPGGQYGPLLLELKKKEIKLKHWKLILIFHRSPKSPIRIDVGKRRATPAFVFFYLSILEYDSQFHSLLSLQLRLVPI